MKFYCFIVSVKYKNTRESIKYNSL